MTTERRGDHKFIIPLLIIAMFLFLGTRNDKTYLYYVGDDLDTNGLDSGDDDTTIEFTAYGPDELKCFHKAVVFFRVIYNDSFLTGCADNYIITQYQPVGCDTACWFTLSDSIHFICDADTLFILDTLSLTDAEKLRWILNLCPATADVEKWNMSYRLSELR